MALASKVRHLDDHRLGIDFRQTRSAKDNKTYVEDFIAEDLVSKGVIDPLHVVKNSLLYGTSIGSILLTADCAVV